MFESLPFCGKGFRARHCCGSLPEKGKSMTIRVALSRSFSRHALGLALAALAVPAHAAPEPGPSAQQAPSAFPMNEDVRTMVRNLGEMAVSPDGRSVVAGISDTTAEGGQSHLWLLAKDAAPRQLTFGRKGEAEGEDQAQFTPDGKAILFIGKRGGVPTIHRLPLAGGEPERLRLMRNAAGVPSTQWGGTGEDGDMSVGGFAFSRDGAHLAIWADEPRAAARTARDARKDDAYSHGEVDERTHLFLLDPSARTVRAVPLDGPFAGADWSLDHTLIVKTERFRDEIGPDARFWSIDPTTLASVALPIPKTARGPAFLPGGKALVYLAQCTQDAPPGCNELFVKDVRTGVERSLVHDLEGGIPESFIVLPDGDLAMTVGTGLRTRLARLSTVTGAVTWRDVGQPVSARLVANARQSGWAFTAAGATQPDTVMVMPRFGGAPAALATPALVPAHWPKVPSRMVRWHNEGLTIEGALYLPPVAPGTRVPLVVNIHGGPTGRFRDGYSNLVQLLAAQGWAVFQPNIRGSTGYGTPFMAANKGDLGGADFRDMMTGIDAVVKDYPVDAARMAMIGYSYGGEMAGFAVGKTDRFKAIVSGAPVINQISEYGTESGAFYDRWFMGRPWLNFADAWRQSPLSTAGNARTPFLLLQGAEDSTDPLGQSLEMYRALKETGSPVALAVYPREGHPQLSGHFDGDASPEPWHGTDLRRRMFGFLRAAFAGNPDPLSVARQDIP